VQLGLDYGGRGEITQAVRKIEALGVPPEAVTEELISQNLYTASIPDPDLIIRTSGEMRTSNFLIWQSAYAEWVFPETYWPDFTEEVFWQMLVEYSRRDRRFGGLSQS
jgi:undecaprenyl diphosphate synthase